MKTTIDTYFKGFIHFLRKQRNGTQELTSIVQKKPFTGIFQEKNSMCRKFQIARGRKYEDI